MTDRPRVLVTGAGGPAGISVLRDLADEPLDALRRRHRPVRRRPLPGRRRRAGRSSRAATTPASCDALLEICRTATVVDRRADGRQRAAAAGAEPRALRGRGVRARPRLERDAADLPGQVGAAPSAAAARARAGHRAVVDDEFDAAAPELPVIVKPRSGSGSRGIRLVERREELEALERDGTLLVQEHLPGHRVLARRPRPRGRARRRASCRASGSRSTPASRSPAARCTTSALDALRPRGGPADRPDRRSPTSRSRRTPAASPRCSRSTRASPARMPLTIAAGVNMPKLAVGEALGTPMPDGPLAFRPSRWCASSRTAFLDFDEIADLQRHAARSRCGVDGEHASPGHARPLDVLRRRRHARGERRRGRGARA